MLTDLPTELVDLIGSFLETTPHSLSSLRLTCRPLYHKSCKAFGRAWFHTATASCDPKDLARLEKIAQNDSIRTAVKQLRVVGLPTYVYNWKLTPYAPLDSSVIERVHICVQRFPNCKSFHVTDDRGGCSSHSWPPDGKWLMADAITLALSSMARYAIRVSSFEIDIGERASPVFDEAFSAIHTLTARASWEQLKVLKLRWKNHYRDDAFPIAKMVVLAMSLESLTLQGSSSCLQTQAILDCLVSSESLPRLKTLALYNMRGVRADTLLAFLGRFSSTLVHLRIHSLALGWGQWNAILNQLVGQHSSLKSVGLSYLCEGTASALHRNVFFRRHGVPIIKFDYYFTKFKCRGDVITGFHFTDRHGDVRAALREMIESYYTVEATDIPVGYSAQFDPYDLDL